MKYRLLLPILALSIMSCDETEPGENSFIFERVSLADTGVELANGLEIFDNYSISDDGRYVAFSAKSPELGVTNNKRQAFWHDSQTDQTILVSRN